MALTSTERQRRYRQTRATVNDGQGERRLNTWVSTSAALALKRLAARENAPQREIIERLILEADQAVIDSLRNDDDGFNRYLEG